MKALHQYLLLCGIIIYSASLNGQDINTQRSLDDNHSLAIDSNDWNIHRLIKEIRLQKDYPGLLLSVGGESREQFRYYSHLNFGDVDSGINDREIYLQHRILLHADLRVNRNFRFFIQFNSSHANGRNAPIHQVDHDDLGIIQAFADLNLSNVANMRIRIGRQEFSFGMERIFALRDGPTIRQNFDGLRLSINPGRTSGDFMLVQPVLYHTGIFDNTRRKKEYILGTYWTLPFNNQHMLDLYLFTVGFQNACFAGDTADDYRHYVGFRLNKETGVFNYDFEFTYEFGTHGASSIDAWAVSSQYSYRWENLPGNPRILFREGVFSGDRKSSDGKINTFRPVSSKPPVHDLVPIGPANILLLSPEAEWVVLKELIFTLRYLYVRRLSANDGMYPSDMRKMTRPMDLPGMYNGHQIINGWAGEILYEANKHITLLLYGGIFKAGNYIRNTGNGLNIEAFSLRATYRF